MVANTLERYRGFRDTAWQWHRDLGWVKKLTMAFVMACLIGLLAQVRIPLPWTPVPVTGQTFAVLLAAVLTGRWWGGISAVIYLGLGIAGIPWFSGWSGGIASIAGPTGGYLIGFVMAALFIGYVTDKFPKTREFIPLLGLMLFADFLLVFGPGLLQLHLWLKFAGDGAVGITQLLGMGLVPFIVGDVVKVFAAAGMAWVLSSKKQL